MGLENGGLTDGFGLGTTKGSFRGPFTKSAYCRAFNLHGGLHLFDDGSGEMSKALDAGDGVIATITGAIENKKRLPVYVAEGTSLQKMRKINSSAYLRHCYDQLREVDTAVFIYGHSADPNDEHIYKAIFESKATHVYFGIYQSGNEKIKIFNGQLSMYQKKWGSDKSYSFYESESAMAWG